VSISNKINSLKEEINFHNIKYYIDDDPEITDHEYDLLFRKLEKLEKENPQFKTLDSPTMRVGSKPKNTFKTIEHSTPMLSLENAMKKNEILAFDERVKKGLKTEQEIELTDIFGPDGLSFTYDAISNDTNKITTSINGSKLILSLVENAFGEIIITTSAFDGLNDVTISKSES